MGKRATIQLIFRKYKINNEIIAVFTNISFLKNNHIMFECYTTTNQHSYCEKYHILNETIPAIKKEYSQLLDEMLHVGYLKEDLCIKRKL